MTDALRYWEPMRIAYNLILAGIVAAAAVHAGIPELQWRATDTRSLLVLAGIANLLYCPAYLVDIPAQFLMNREQHRTVRLVLFGLGSSLAGYLTWQMSGMMFVLGQMD